MSNPRYIEKTYIGSGGMAKVYKAFDEVLRRHVAIKELTEHLRDNDDVKRLFTNEARKMAAVRHQNVVQVYDVDDSGEIPTIIMEYMGGGSLATQVGTASLPAEDVLDIVKQIVLGLQAIHNAGLVHRDVKPENILEESGAYKITDFGVAMSGEEEALPFVTNKYAAPEVLIAPDKIGASSDIYSVGIMAIELLLGPHQFEVAVREAIESDNKLQLPALQDSAQAFWQQWIASDVELPLLNTIDDSISQDVAEFLSKLTKRERSSRIDDCGALLSELNSVIKTSSRRASAETEYSSKMDRRFQQAKASSETPPEEKKKKPLWFKLAVGVGSLFVLAVIALLMVPSGPPNYYFDIQTDPPGAAVTLNGELIEASPTPTRVVASWGATLLLQLEDREPLEIMLAEGMPGLSSTDESVVLQVAFPDAFAISNSAEASAFLQEQLPQSWPADAYLNSVNSLTDGPLDIEIGSDLNFQVHTEQAAFLTMLHLGSDNYLTQIYPSPSGFAPNVNTEARTDIGEELNLMAREPLGKEWFVFVFTEDAMSQEPMPEGISIGNWATAFEISGNGSPGESYILDLVEELKSLNASAIVLEMNVIAQGTEL